jgi:membrane protein YqaA with SNARE-associated domain
VLDSIFTPVLDLLALPLLGLGVVFAVSVLAATILPLGSEPIFLAYLAAKPGSFWVAVWVATVGNSLGGLITYWMGAGVQRTYRRWRARPLQELSAPLKQAADQHGHVNSMGAAPLHSEHDVRALNWVRRFGAPALLLAWLPVIGDPLCALAGWLRLPWVPCLIFMSVGKFGRYLVLGGALELVLS